MNNRATELSLQQLRTFRDVYELGGYAAAARKSLLSVPTVWQHIQSLEKQYGVGLFEKVGRRVEPTAAARRLYGAIDELLVGFESTFDLVTDEKQSSDTITLVSGVRMMMDDLADPLSSFRAKYPNRLLVRQGNNRRAEELLMSGQADLALSLEPGFQQQAAGIHYEPAYSVDFLAVAPKRHPFWQSRGSSLRALVKHDLVVTAPGTHGRDALEHALHREHLTANIAVETDNSGFTIACVRAGMGLGIVAGRPDGASCARLKTLSLRRQLGQRQIVFMWRKGRLMTDAICALIEEIRRQRSV